MIFARFACQQAEGLILAHTLRLPNRLIKKGHTLTAEDINELQQQGIEYVTGARIEVGDIAENEAAFAIASVLASKNIRIGKPVAGRCNLYARTQGLVTIDRERVDAINCCDGAVTIATLAPDDEAEAGQTIATIKIIPFAVSRALLDKCCGLAGESAIGLKPFAVQRVALILTEAANVKPSVLDATHDVMQQRVRSYGSYIAFEQRCAHTIDAVEKALQAAFISECELVLVCGATITVDVGDIVPSAITRIGGEIVHFGMPVEPGNMLLLARHGSKTIINLPGCSRSPKLNGVDWVLQRTLAGVAVSKRDIMLMGVGGLIKDVPHIARKQRVVSAVEESDEKSTVNVEQENGPHIAAVILAAGSSRRMGEKNKLLAAVGDKTMLEHVVQAALASDAQNVVVVTGHEAEEIQQALTGCEVSFVYNPEYATGMASSLRTGLSALDDDVDAALILLADMPFIHAKQINALIDAFNPNSENDIVAPVRDGRRGNPVLWARRYFEEMLILEGDAGARSLLKKYAKHIVEQPMDDDAVFIDIDTPELLESLPDLVLHKTDKKLIE